MNAMKAILNATTVSDSTVETILGAAPTETVSVTPVKVPGGRINKDVDCVNMFDSKLASKLLACDQTNISKGEADSKAEVHRSNRTEVGSNVREPLVKLSSVGAKRRGIPSYGRQASVSSESILGTESHALRDCENKPQVQVLNTVKSVSDMAETRIIKSSLPKIPHSSNNVAHVVVTQPLSRQASPECYSTHDFDSNEKLSLIEPKQESTILTDSNSSLFRSGVLTAPVVLEPFHNSRSDCHSTCSMAPEDFKLNNPSKYVPKIVSAELSSHKNDSEACNASNTEAYLSGTDCDDISLSFDREAMYNKHHSAIEDTDLGCSSFLKVHVDNCSQESDDIDIPVCDIQPMQPMQLSVRLGRPGVTSFSRTSEFLKDETSPFNNAFSDEMRVGTESLSRPQSDVDSLESLEDVSGYSSEGDILSSGRPPRGTSHRTLFGRNGGASRELSTQQVLSHGRLLTSKERDGSLYQKIKNSTDLLELAGYELIIIYYNSTKQAHP